MKCSSCGKKVIWCKHCHTEFEEGDDVVCYDDDHYCDGDCVIEYLDLIEGYAMGED